MNNEVDNDLDLLDLEDEEVLDNAPAACSPFATPRPARPWLLLGLGLLIIVLATYIIVRSVGGPSSSSVEIDLDVPPVEGVVDEPPLVVPGEPAVVPVPPVNVVAVPTTPGVPVRVVPDRNDTVEFKPNPTPAAPKPAAKPAPKPATKPVAAPKPTATVGGWYVQFGSYSTRALAESAQKKITAEHSGLMSGKQFVILAAQVNGKTTYRLRIAFTTQNDANMFCRNAKSDGLDCYVAK